MKKLETSALALMAMSLLVTSACKKGENSETETQNEAEMVAPETTPVMTDTATAGPENQIESGQQRTDGASGNNGSATPQNPSSGSGNNGSTPASGSESVNDGARQPAAANPEN